MHWQGQLFPSLFHPHRSPKHSATADNGSSNTHVIRPAETTLMLSTICVLSLLILSHLKTSAGGVSAGPQLALQELNIWSQSCGSLLCRATEALHWTSGTCSMPCCREGLATSQQHIWFQSCAVHCLCRCWATSRLFAELCSMLSSRGWAVNHIWFQS